MSSVFNNIASNPNLVGSLPLAAQPAGLGRGAFGPIPWLVCAGVLGYVAKNYEPAEIQRRVTEVGSFAINGIKNNIQRIGKAALTSFLVYKGLDVLRVADSLPPTFAAATLQLAGPDLEATTLVPLVIALASVKSAYESPSLSGLISAAVGSAFFYFTQKHLG